MQSEIVISVATVVGEGCDDVEVFILEATKVLSQSYRYYELLMVDNGSMDGTDQRVQQLQQEVPNLRVLRLSKRYDIETAFAAALDNSVGDYIVLLEMEDDPVAMVPEMIRKAQEGYDAVIGVRGEEADGLLARWLDRMAYRITARILGYQLRPNTSYFRVLSRQACNSITRIRNKRRYLRYLNASVGFRQTHMKYQPLPRGSRREGFGRHGRRFFRWLDLVLSNSAVPLRAATVLALIASAGNLLYLFYVLAVTLFKREIAEGWISTSVMTGSMFFLLFLVLTVLSEYVARLTEEIQERPLYFIEYEANSAVDKAGTTELNVV